ncbi:uncharacterized protein LOC142333303 [Lycorma delicatula]|uniref:uncharacterized protein LOC142333303 n=1 Tax=Lycorma delicatula TaxID=130591 RepID=UPI003F5107DA
MAVEKTTKRPDFQTFVSKGKENIVEKTIGSEDRSAKKGENLKSYRIVLSARSLTDAEYDEIFTADIQRSFTYSSDEKFLSNDNSRENSTFFDGPDSSSTTAPGSKGKKKNIIEPKGSIKMVESNKKPLYEENEGHKNDTVESHDESVIMEDSSEDIVSNSDLDTTFDKTVDIFEKKKKKKTSKLSHGEKLRMICEMMSPWGSHASNKSHSQSSSLSTRLILHFKILRKSFQKT